MIYLDSAATSLQKPRAVGEAMLTAMRTMASPGRGGHAPARRASDVAFRCRIALAELFNVAEPEDIVFTMNATHAINIALASLVSPGGRVVTSGWEHNAVTRALHLLGASVDVVPGALFDRTAVIEGFARRIPGAECVVCTHVSNVFGYVLPVYEIAKMCREHEVPFVLDASQSAGALDIDAKKLGAAFIAMPGHKGLLGPQGTGVLICNAPTMPIMAGGTGSSSRSRSMPDFLPDRLEAGTHNIPGIAGLLAGVEYVQRRGVDAIGRHERKLERMAAEALQTVPGLEVFASPDEELQAGVLSVRHETVGCEELGIALDSLGVCVRAGLHCAPLAHESAGTLETGTVRLSFSPFNTERELRQLPQLMRRAIAMCGK